MAYKVVQAQGTALTDLYTVPSDKQAVISSLTACNFGTVAVSYDLLVRPAGAAAADIHNLAKGVALLPNETAFITAGLALGTADVLSVLSSGSAVTFMAFVNETDA